jgi:neutral ceramidase
MKRFLLLLVPAALLAQGLQVGVARRDVTPREPVPMWGYGARHDRLSAGTLDPLFADALVISAGGAKIAVVGLDLGRAPSEASLQRIRRRIREEGGIEHSILAGSHTHHGPVLELSDEAGKGRGRFDAAIRYYREMEDAIAGAILDANAKLAPARMAAGSVQLEGFNRNRHSKLSPIPNDRELAVMRFDGADGRPIAILANFTAHPTMIPAADMRFSADFPGAMKELVAKETGAAAIFMPGAAGDHSADGQGQGYQEFGRRLGREVVKLASSLAPAAAAKASLAVKEDRFRFASRTDLSNGFIRDLYSKAFFPELIANYVDEYADGVRPRLTVALLNGEIAMVAGSGEFFSAHALRLRERARVRQVFFFGFSNGYHQYFPTIEAAAEGGYGADATVAPAEVGAGERILDAALMWIYQLLGKLQG